MLYIFIKAEVYMTTELCTSSELHVLNMFYRSETILVKRDWSLYMKHRKIISWFIIHIWLTDFPIITTSNNSELILQSMDLLRVKSFTPHLSMNSSFLLILLFNANANVVTASIASEVISSV